MKALNLYGIGDLRYEDAPMPKRGKGEVLLKICAVGICGSDISRVFDKGTYHFPTIIGHEFSGEIIESEDKALIGQRVTVFPLLPCGKCEACKSERYAQCVNYDYYGSRRNGAMAEYLAVKKSNLVIIPKNISYESAAMTEPAAVAVHVLKKANATPKDTIVIIGVGPIALIMASLAKNIGANVILAARNEEKVRFAKSLGFNNVVNKSNTDIIEYIKQQTAGKGADICVEGTGVSEGLEICALCAKNFGKIIALANPLGEMKLSQNAYWQIMRRELELIGAWNSSFSKNENDWQDAVNAMENNTINAESLITHRFKLAEYTEAFDLMREKREMYCKVMFVMGDK